VTGVGAALREVERLEVDFEAAREATKGAREGGDE
jgi:hypothetical protein